MRRFCCSSFNRRPLKSMGFFTSITLLPPTRFTWRASFSMGLSVPAMSFMTTMPSRTRKKAFFFRDLFIFNPRPAAFIPPSNCTIREKILRASCCKIYPWRSCRARRNGSRRIFKQSACRSSQAARRWKDGILTSNRTKLCSPNCILTTIFIRMRVGSASGCPAMSISPIRIRRISTRNRWRDMGSPVVMSRGFAAWMMTVSLC